MNAARAFMELSDGDVHFKEEKIIKSDKYEILETFVLCIVIVCAGNMVLFSVAGF